MTLFNDYVTLQARYRVRHCLCASDVASARLDDWARARDLPCARVSCRAITLDAVEGAHLQLTAAVEL